MANDIMKQRRLARRKPPVDRALRLLGGGEKAIPNTKRASIPAAHLNIARRPLSQSSRGSRHIIFERGGCQERRRSNCAIEGTSTGSDIEVEHSEADDIPSKLLTSGGEANVVAERIFLGFAQHRPLPFKYLFRSAHLNNGFENRDIAIGEARHIDLYSRCRPAFRAKCFVG